MTIEKLFRNIALVELGYFGKGRRGRANAQRFYDADLFDYWCGSATASYFLAKARVIAVD